MEQKVHFIFTIVMSAFMIFFMSLVVTLVNLGISDMELLMASWAKGFVVAWIVGAPLMFIFAPIFRKAITKKMSNKTGKIQ